MKILVCEEPGKLVYRTANAPVPKPGYAILRIRRIGVCGTDLHAFKGDQPYFKYPRILGHELSGELIDAGGAEGFSKGEILTFLPYNYCGHCIACRAGKTNCCANLQVYGVHADGGMVQYLQVPTHLLIKGAGLNVEELALVEPLAIGAHGVRRAAVQAGEWVLVTGAGPIGLGVMEFARIAGGNTIAVDINDQRLQFCRGKLGVQHTINPLQEDLLSRLDEITGGDRAPVVIEATGNRQAMINAFEYLAHGGRYVLVGLQKEALHFSHPAFHKREATLMSSRNATRGDFGYVIGCLQKGLINPANYITHRVTFNQVKDEFESWLNPATGVIKAVISMD